MSKMEFDEIVSAYGEVLEKYAGYLLMPAEELPATKDEIKEAIKLELIIRKKFSDKEMIEFLKYGYAELASFVPEELFLRYKQLGKMMLKGAVLQQHDLLDEHAKEELLQEIDNMLKQDNYAYPSDEIEERRDERDLLLAEISSYIRGIT